MFGQLCTAIAWGIRISSWSDSVQLVCVSWPSVKLILEYEYKGLDTAQKASYFLKRLTVYLFMLGRNHIKVHVKLTSQEEFRGFGTLNTQVTIRRMPETLKTSSYAGVQPVLEVRKQFCVDKTCNCELMNQCQTVPKQPCLQCPAFQLSLAAASHSKPSCQSLSFQSMSRQKSHSIDFQHLFVSPHTQRKRS